MGERKFAVILAGGSGRRMGSTTPKQFIELCGKPILRHTVERFLEYDPSIGIITVIPGQYKQFWKEYCEKSGFIERYSMPSGGITRFHSVQNALEYVPDGALVAVHDGVRPFVSAGFISSLFETARADGSAVPVLPVIDSIREIGPEGSSSAVDRSRFVAVQTPQVFRSELLKEAYRQPYSVSFTDDASVVEAMGCRISLCEGRRENIKITTAEDLIFARDLLLRPLCPLQENP